MHLESVCKCCCSSLKMHKFSDWLEQHVQNTASPLSWWQKAVAWSWKTLVFLREMNQVTACESLWRAVVLYSVEVQDSCLSHFPEVLSASWWSPHSELATRGLRWCCSWLCCTLSAVNHTVQHISLFVCFLSHLHISFSLKKTAIYRQMFLIHLQKKKQKNNHKCFIQSRRWFCLSPWTSHGLSIWGGEKQENLAADFEKQHKTPFAHGGVHFDAATSRGSTKSSSCRGVWLISTGSHIMSGLLGPVKSNHSSTYCKVIVRVLKMIYFIVVKIVSALEKHL